MLYSIPMSSVITPKALKELKEEMRTGEVLAHSISHMLKYKKTSSGEAISVSVADTTMKEAFCVSYY